MKKLANKINMSASFIDSKEDVFLLMKLIGLSEGYEESLSKGTHATCSYDTGMYISKAYDIIGVKPKMKWLPSEIKDLY